jgi:hypothetical protein
MGREPPSDADEKVPDGGSQRESVDTILPSIPSALPGSQARKPSTKNGHTEGLPDEGVASLHPRRR